MADKRCGRIAASTPNRRGDGDRREEEKGPPPDAGERRTRLRPAHGRRPPQRQGPPLRRLTYPPRRERRRTRAGAAPARARPATRRAGREGLLRRPAAAQSAGPDDPTLVIRPDELQPRDAEEADQFTTSETSIVPPAETATREAAEPPRRRLARLDRDLRGSRPASRACSASCARSSRRTTSAPRGKINAFTIAFQIPNLFRALVADAALSSAFVPGLHRPAREGQEARLARRVDPLLADAARADRR